jgi:hypothetical protein
MSFEATQNAVLACLEANTTPAVVGAPGIGKSAMLKLLARERGKELQILNGGSVADDDITGTPYVDPRTGNLSQAHRGPLRAAIERPCLLALDEWTTLAETSHPAGLALTLDKRAGDRDLHPETDVVVLYNPPEHAPGAMRFSAATANRLVTFHMEPKAGEVAKWFQAQENPFLSEFGIFLSHDPTLIELQPSPQDIEAGRTWASPRACERGIRSFGAHAIRTKLALSEGKSDGVAFALIEGSMGPAAAGRYFAAREQRRHLPTLDAILADPKDTAENLKEDPAAQIAAVSILPTLRRHDTGAAWVWSANLRGRFRGAATAVLMGPGDWVDGQWAHEGKRAQIKLVAAAVKR